MKNILCLDDSRIALKVLERSLKGLGEVICALSIQEAEKALDDCDINIFILDFLLPDGNSIDLATKIRKLERYKETPIILISAGLTTEIAYNAMRSGINQSLKKPVGSDELRKIVSQQLESPTIHGVERSYNKLRCIAWEMHDVHYEYSPDINRIVQDNTKEGAHLKMNNLLNNVLNDKTDSFREIIGIEIVNHVIKTK
jgi:DNA-binding NtrC family response regulator